MSAIGIDSLTQSRLLRYLADTQALPNESAKTHRFVALVQELFGAPAVTTELTGGIEKRVRIDAFGTKKRGRIDAFYGNAVIEFERSLAATGETAAAQLREYCAAVWAKEGRPFRPLVGIATDGVEWRTYYPSIPPTSISVPETKDIQLGAPIRTIVLQPETLHDFWLWLTSLLFRPSRTEPSARMFRNDFGSSSPVFARVTELLAANWESLQDSSESKLAFRTWRKYLSLTYGNLTASDAELTPLFLTHTYLACIARLLAWAAVSKGLINETHARVITDVWSGDFFKRFKIENVVEDDFFHWVGKPAVLNSLMPEWERVLNQMLSYDLTRIDEDILKGVYQELVDPKDRHDLGEYYTPDWLCEHIVAKTLPASSFASVLDPSCGSGSFLRASINHFLGRNNHLPAPDRLMAILSNVMGIDIHPLAVTISKITYLLAIAPVIHAAKRPVQIPIYLADSLSLPTEGSQPELYQQGPSYAIRFGGNRKVSIPQDLVHTPELFDPAIAACAKIAADHAATAQESKSALVAYLRNAVPDIAASPNRQAIEAALWDFTCELSELIKKEEDTIWAFVVRNAYRPAMMRGRFDFILGNPPWLAYRYIKDAEYQSEIKRLAQLKYKVASTKEKLLTQTELATVFLVHALSTFGKAGAKLAFVMPYSVLRADQHENLRRRLYRAPIAILHYWDLLRVAPLFRVPSCVLFARNTGRPPRWSESYELPCTIYAAQFPQTDVNWAVAQPLIKKHRRKARLIYLGQRCALSTTPGAVKSTLPSAYSSRFKNGATIYPRNFYFVSVNDVSSIPVKPDQLYDVRTDPVRAKLAKEPYKDMTVSGQVEGRFLYTTALSDHVLPFFVAKPSTIALPVIEKHGTFQLKTEKTLRAAGHRETADWWRDVEAAWKSRQPKGKRKADASAGATLDHHSKLSAQSNSDAHLVLYNASGTDVSAAYLDRNATPRPFVVDHKLYYCVCGNQQEADYLCAVLNSRAVNLMIKPFQSMGLLGQRDIHKKLLELPIPTWTSTRPDLLELADLGREARILANGVMAKYDGPKGLARRRRYLREALSDLLQSIDAKVTKLLTARGHVRA
jgi:hypothetical protein